MKDIFGTYKRSNICEIGISFWSLYWPISPPNNPIVPYSPVKNVWAIIFIASQSQYLNLEILF